MDISKAPSCSDADESEKSGLADSRFAEDLADAQILDFFGVFRHQDDRGVSALT